MAPHRGNALTKILDQYENGIPSRGGMGMARRY